MHTCKYAGEADYIICCNGAQMFEVDGWKPTGTAKTMCLEDAKLITETLQARFGFGDDPCIFLTKNGPADGPGHGCVYTLKMDAQWDAWAKATNHQAIREMFRKIASVVPDAPLDYQSQVPELADADILVLQFMVPQWNDPELKSRKQQIKKMIETAPTRDPMLYMDLGMGFEIRSKHVNDVDGLGKQTALEVQPKHFNNMISSTI